MYSKLVLENTHFGPDELVFVQLHRISRQFIYQLYCIRVNVRKAFITVRVPKHDHTALSTGKLSLTTVTAYMNLRRSVAHRTKL